MKGKFACFTRIALVFLPLVSAGCITITYDADIKPVYDKLPEIEKVPVITGIYYSPEFAGYVHVRFAGLTKNTASIGKHSVAMFDRIFPRVFDKVVKIETVPTSAAPASGVDWIIEPVIEAADFRFTGESYHDGYSLTYRLAIYSREGVPVSSWTVVGKGDFKQGFFSGWSTDHIAFDMQDAAAKFMKKFQAARARGAPPMIPQASVAAPAAQRRVARPGEVTASAGRNMEPKWFRELLPPPVSTGGSPEKPARSRNNAGEVIPIRVTITNHTNREIIVRESDMRLVLPAAPGRSGCHAGNRWASAEFNYQFAGR